MEAFREHTSRKLRGVLCPDHKQAPRLKFRGDTLRDISIQISACCDKLSTIANDRIAGINRDAEQSSDPRASLHELESARQPELPAA